METVHDPAPLRQRRGSLTLQNESGQSANGNVSGRQLTTNWAGTGINGTISQNGNRIDWDNGTYWVRFRVY